MTLVYFQGHLRCVFILSRETKILSCVSLHYLMAIHFIVTRGGRSNKENVVR